MRGKDRDLFQLLLHCQNHPRTCEEKYGGTIYATKKIGITPAHAGKSPPEGGKGGL